MPGWKVQNVLNPIGARPLEEFGWAASVDAVVDQGALHLSGWVLASDKVIQEILLWQEGWVASAPIGEPSPDIAWVYGHHPQSGAARFAMSLPLDDGTLTAKVFALHARTQDGARMHIASLVCRRTLAAAPRIFVVGSPRSGTTAVGNALREALGGANYGESHVMPLLQSLIEETDRRLGDPNVMQASQQPANMIGHLPSEEFRERMAESFRSMYRQLNGGDSFCDKTPGVEMLRSVPLAHWLWPDAKFIFCKRRGMDNVASRMRKFAQDDFLGHCHDWAMAMQVWLEVSPEVPAENIREVDQFQLLEDPEGVGLELAAWCGLTPAQGEVVAQYLANEVPERTKVGSRQPVGLADMKWTDEQIDTFREVCGPMMARYGYAESDAYWVARETQ